MNTKKQNQKKKNFGISGENFSRHPHFREKEFFFLAQSIKSFPKLYLRRKGNNKQCFK